MTLDEMQAAARSAFERALEAQAEGYALEAQIAKARGDERGAAWNEALARVYRERFSAASMAAKDEAYRAFQASAA